MAHRGAHAGGAVLGQVRDDEGRGEVGAAGDSTLRSRVSARELWRNVCQGGDFALGACLSAFAEEICDLGKRRVGSEAGFGIERHRSAVNSQGSAWRKTEAALVAGPSEEDRGGGRFA